MATPSRTTLLALQIAAGKLNSSFAGFRRLLVYSPCNSLAVSYRRSMCWPSRTICTSVSRWSKKEDSTTTSSSEKASKSQAEDELPNHTHFRLSTSQHPLGKHLEEEHGVKLKVPDSYWDNPIPHQIYSEQELQNVKFTHKNPVAMYDRAALFAVKLMRGGFDFVSRYKGPGGEMTRRAWMNRCLFLETVAGVPGMVAGMARHLKSLRTMKRDYGWIHTLLAEAENERMHLLIFMKMKDPGMLFRLMVIVGQGVFFNTFFLTYLVSPRTCHRFVGYLEEEAVKTYTGLLKDLAPDGHLKDWGQESAPVIARRYYKLDDNATVIDVVKCIRADEATHRDVNHTFAGLDPDMDKNPFVGKHGRST